MKITKKSIAERFNGQDNTSCPSNNVCLGSVYLGSTTASGSGAWTLNVPAGLLAVGNKVTATSTAGGASTSNFSVCVTCTAPAITACTNLTNPLNGATNVYVTTALS